MVVLLPVTLKTHYCDLANTTWGQWWRRLQIQKLAALMVERHARTESLSLLSARLTLGTRGFFSPASRGFVSSAEGRRHERQSYLRLDQNRKPRMKSLWHPGHARFHFRINNFHACDRVLSRVRGKGGGKNDGGDKGSKGVITRHHLRSTRWTLP